ncbi:MAG: bifunctional metallophosphatase/5'-nucleotidase, partial [Acetobacteraceae bacterium]|nr:bifunctional metallophosphatase/5'-nucleotidase [Acetobacteraceae bacterium]
MIARRHLLAASLAAAGWVRLSAAAPARVISVLHQNDLHSRHDPDAAGNGGSARIAALFARERRSARAEGRVCISLDAGDQFVGSLYFSHWLGEAERRVMQAIGFDAMTLGNHDFDRGPEVTGRFVRALPFPVLAANLDSSAEPALAGSVPPSALIEREGARIGLVGITLPATPAISSPGQKLRFLPALPALADQVARLRAGGAATVIALTHIGLDADRRLVAASQGLDLVVGGHSHTLLANDLPGAAGPTPEVVADADGRRVPIVQVGAYGRCMGRVDLVLDDAGSAAMFRADAFAGASRIAPDAGVEAVLAGLQAPIAELHDRVLGEATGNFRLGGCRIGECPLGNLVADAMLAAARPMGAVAAITNAGGMRAALAPGPVTRGHVVSVLPFGNTLSVVTLSGADLRTALEHGVALPPEAGGSGRFPQVAGLVVRYDMLRPAGARLT